MLKHCEKDVKNALSIESDTVPAAKVFGFLTEVMRNMDKVLNSPTSDRLFFGLAGTWFVILSLSVVALVWLVIWFNVTDLLFMQPAGETIINSLIRAFVG